MPDNATLKRHSSVSQISAAMLTALLLLSAFFASPILANGVREGVELFFAVLFPTLFPFSLLTDLYLSLQVFDRFHILPKLFSCVFRLPEEAFSCFVIGLVCGFPLGARTAKKLYERGVLTKEEAEKLIVFTSAPSPAFCIGGVGVGLLHSRKIGTILYIACVMSAIVTGIIFRPHKRSNIKLSNIISEQKYDFNASLQSVLHSCFSLFGIICVFSVLAFIAKSLIPNEAISAFFLAFFEIGNACKAISSCLTFTPFSSILLIGFCVGFSGISVWTQITATVSESGISTRTYLPKKLLQGVLCAFLSAFLSSFIINA